MRNVWHMNIIGSQTDAESYLEYTCLEESLQANLAYCPLVFNIQTGCNQRKAIENQLFSRGAPAAATVCDIISAPSIPLTPSPA